VKSVARFETALKVISGTQTAQKELSMVVRKSSDHITLCEAARRAPGRPSANSMWRWCRNGIIARNGERVRLKHVRAGGKIFTTADWVEEFCTHLADADRCYFDAKQTGASSLPPRDPSFGTRHGRAKHVSHAWKNDNENARIDRELDEEGL
jgi:hypothetical protein